MSLHQDIICSTPLSEEDLARACGLFFREIRPHRERLIDYYLGRQSVPKGEAVRGRPDNRLRVPFPRYITQVQTGYFLGQPPTLAFDRSDEGAVFAALPDADHFPCHLYQAARDASVCGMGAVLVWLDRSGPRVCPCDPMSVFFLRDAAAGSPVRAGVRLFQDQDGTARGVLYEPERLRAFVLDRAGVRFETEEENLLHALPLIPFYNNSEGRGDFEAVTGLVDAYNLLLSGALDDMQSVANAFLALYGMQGTTQADIDQANRSRILSLSEGGRAEFVVKNLNHEALGQLEENLRRSILQLSMTPDLSDQNFAGNASGVALQYKLWGIEQVRSAKEQAFTDGILALLQALAGGLATLGRPVSFRAKPAFYKNLPQDAAALSETLLSLSPLLSRRTILERLPYVDDPVEEERRKEQEEINLEE